MLHNICGRAKSGKTEYLYKVCDRLIGEKKHTFLIVPEQGAVLTERQVIDRLGNRSNEYVEVINFKRLCNRVFRETGGLTQSYVDSAHKLLIMHRALEDVRDFLIHYKGASEVSDFVKKALDTVTEFKMYGVTPRMLEKSAEALYEKGNKQLCDKLKDFSLIYAQYSVLLTETLGYHDSNDDLERLCSVLSESGFFKGKTVIIDSFYGFTVPQLEVIKRILADADDVYVSYLLDKDDGIFFNRGKKAYGKICKFAMDVGIESETIYLDYCDAFESKMLGSLERHFGNELCGITDNDEVQDDGTVKIISCASPYEEAKMCAAIINNLTSCGKAKFSDIAVCARSLEGYNGLIDTVLRQNGIPFGYSKRYDLMTRPVSAYIMSAFEFSRTKSKQSVLRLIKTGLTKLSDTEADLTECYIRTWNIQGRMFTDGEWLMNPDGYTSAADMSERAKNTLATVEKARQKLITPLVVFDEEIREARNANEISVAVIKLLEQSKYRPKGLSEDEIVYHNMVMDALDCIADVIGEEHVTPKSYASLFEMIMSEYDTGKIPVTVDEVNIADAELMRTAGVSYVIVMGLCDGVFPKIPTANGVFSDREKEILDENGIELSETSTDFVFDELFLAYKVLTSPTKGLYMTYYSKSSVGDEMRCSEIISMVKNALPSLTEKDALDEPEIRLCLCDDMLVADASASTMPEYSCAVKKYLTEKGFDLSRLTSQSFENLCEETTGKLFGEVLTLSPSRLEKFNHCAFSYFAQYTLALRPEPVANLGPSESGNIIHRILELLIRELAQKKERGEEITAELAINRERELLCEHINELIGSENAQKRLTKRFKYLYERLSGALDACVTVMAGEFTVSEFLPTDFEMSIGKAGADVSFASIPITNGNGEKTGELIINGKIDRTDVYKKDGKAYIKVLDYKTGHKVFNLEDVVQGINLQMLLYLYSLTENAAVRYGVEKVVPAGVVYAPIHRPSLSAQLGQEINGDITSSFKPNGIVIDDMEILTAMDRSFTGKFVPVKLKADGSFYSNSSVTSLETMGRLLSTAADVASKLAGEIQSGKISRNPYKCKKCDSCTTCDYSPFCRYTKGDEGTRYTMTSYSDEVFEKTAKGDDGNG